MWTGLACLRSVLLAWLVWFATDVQAISYVTRTGVTAKLTVTTMAIKVATTAVANDLLVAQIVIDKDAGCSPALITAPAGWSLIRCDTSTSGGVTQALYYRVALGTDTGATHTWRKATATSGIGVVFVFRGADPGNPIDDPLPSGLAFSGTNLATATDLSGMTPGARAVTMVASNIDSANTYVSSTGWTEHSERRCSTTCLDLSSTAASRTYLAGGATTSVITTLKSNADGVVQLLALRPAPSSLKAYFPLDGTNWLNDVSGSGFDASAAGTATNGAGQVCTGLAADGAGWLTVADPSSTELDFLGNAYTISAWVYPSSYAATGGYRSIVSKQNLYRLDINSAGKLYWTWNATSAGGTARSRTSVSTIPLNQWTHIAVIYNKNDSVARQRIFITPAGASAVVQDATTGTYNDTLWNSSKKVFIGANESDASRNFVGFIDELRLYDGVQTPAEITEDYLAGHACGVNHYRISIGSGNGSICASGETITVTACSDVGTATSCTPYPGSVTGIYLKPNDGNWVGGASSVRPLSLVGGVGAQDYDKNTTGTVTFEFDTSAATPSPEPNSASNKYRCFVANGEVALGACQINFEASTVSIDLAMNGFIACKDEAVGAVNVEKCGGAALPATQNVSFGASFVDPATGTKTLTVKGVGPGASAQTLTPGGATKEVTLTLNATDQNYPFVVNYPDAGKLNLSASVPSVSGSGSADLISSPYRIELFSNETSSVCEPASATCSAFKKAGESFALQARAACYYTGTFDKTTPGTPGTPNFRMSAIPMAVDPVSPTPGNPVSASGSVDFDATTSGNGEVTLQTSVSEVGVFKLTAAKTAMPYLISGSVVGSPSSNIGRFYPDHFALVSSDFTAGCGVFTYMGQDFSLSASLEARKVGGGKTSNFTGVFANGGVLPEMVNGSSGVSLDNARLSVPGTAAWDAGVYDFVATGLARLAAPDGPFENLDLGLRVDAEAALAANLRPYLIDRDMAAATSSCTADSTGTSDGTCTAKRVASAVKVRFGRLRLQNVFGSEKLALAVPMQAQHWAGGYFVNNADDSCTTLSDIAAPTAVVKPTERTLVGAAKPGPAQGLYFPPIDDKNTLGVADVEAAFQTLAGAASSALSGGQAKLALPNGSGKRGWLDLVLQVPDYLLGNWGNCSNQIGAVGLFDDFPCARATFGIFGARSPIVYRRENY